MPLVPLNLQVISISLSYGFHSSYFSKKNTFGVASFHLQVMHFQVPIIGFVILMGHMPGAYDSRLSPLFSGVCSATEFCIYPKKKSPYLKIFRVAC